MANGDIGAAIYQFADIQNTSAVIYTCFRAATHGRPRVIFYTGTLKLISKHQKGYLVIIFDCPYMGINTFKLISEHSACLWACCKYDI